MPNDVVRWLEDLGLGEYADAFVENRVDMDVLADLTGDDLKEIGVQPIGDRRKLLSAIAAIAPTTDPAGQDQGVGAVAVDDPPPATPDAMRRQISVLFADISGFTRVSSGLDAEQTHALLNEFFEAVGRIVVGYGGTVDKHIGDAVMAVFGAPTAHADDPERAARAACDVHAAVRFLTMPLQVHVGIASGQVVASTTGGLAHTEYTVTGDSVNLAARLTDLASAGETLVSASVHRALGDVFRGESIGERLIDGLPEAISVWRLDSVAEARHRRRRPFVGREAERSAFQAALEASVRAHAGGVFIVRGEPGIGKTRLVEEFERMGAARGFAVHAAMVLDFGTAKGQDAARALTRSLLGLPPASEKQQRAAAASQAFADERLKEERRAYLNDLLDLEQTPALRGIYDAMDNTARNTGKMETLAELAHAVSTASPLIVKVEDLHWASPLILSYVARLARLTARAPIMLVLTTRQSGHQLDDAWRAGCGDAAITTFDLPPINVFEASQLAESFAGVSESMVKACVERASGNPLFLEQLLYNSEDAERGELPGTIQGIVQARLDTLPPDDLQAMQAASVLGKRFAGAAVEAVMDAGTFRPERLAEQALIREEGSDYLFAHALIHEATYEAILRSRRAEMHRRAAAWYAGQDLVLRAQHLDAANDPAATEAYLEAARQQYVDFRFGVALELIERAQALACSDDTAFGLSSLEGDLLRELGDTAGSVEAFKAAMPRAKRPRQACEANLGLAEGLRILDRLDEGFEALQRAEALAGGDVELLARVHFLRGNYNFPLGRFEACLEEHSKAAHYCRSSGQTRYEALAEGGLGDAHYLSGQMRSALRHFERCVELARSCDASAVEVSNLVMLGIAQRFDMRLLDGEKTLRRGLEAAKTLGMKRAQLMHTHVLSYLLEEQGQYDEPAELLSECAAIVEEIGAFRFRAVVLTYQSRLAMHAGDGRRALEIAREAVASSDEHSFSFTGPWSIGQLIRVSEGEERAAAMRRAEDALAEGCVSHNYLYYFADAMESCLRLEDWAGVEKAADGLARYVEREPIPWADLQIRRANALARIGRGDRDPRLIAELREVRAEASGANFATLLPTLDAQLARIAP